jgi:hypothetical protein
LCHVGECEAETEEDDADAQNAFAAKLQPATPLLGEVTAERIGKNDANEMPTTRGESDKCWKKGRVLKAVATAAKRTMSKRPGMEGSWNLDCI